MAFRVAVLGCWHVHARDYAEMARRHDGTELVAVWDDDEDRGRAGAAEFGTDFVPDLEALFNSDRVDGVVITTQTSAHRDVMVQAAGAGKHIFTEKLLAPTVAEADEIVAAADAHRVCLVVSLPRLYTGYTRSIAEVTAAGTLGRVSYCRVRLSHDGAIAHWLPERFFDPAAAIGGALTDLGCHPAYLIQLFLGAEPDAVSATYRRVTGHAVEDHAVVTVGYPNEAIGVIEAGFVSESPFTIEVHGTEGSLLFDDHTGVLAGFGPAFGGTATVPVGTDGPTPFEQWLSHIADGTRADDNLARAVALTRLVVAANDAARTGRTVSP